MDTYTSNRKILEAYQKVNEVYYTDSNGVERWYNDFDKHGFPLRNRTDIQRSMPRFGDYQDDEDGEYYYAQLCKFATELDAYCSAAEIYNDGSLCVSIPATHGFTLERVMKEYKIVKQAAKLAGWGVGETEQDVKEKYASASKRDHGTVSIAIDDRDKATMIKDGDVVGESAEDIPYIKKNFDKLTELRNEFDEVFHRDIGIILDSPTLREQLRDVCTQTIEVLDAY